MSNIITGIRPAYDIELAVDALSREDPLLGALIEQIGPYQLNLRYIKSPFLSLLRAIVYQQLSGKAAATIHGRLNALFDGGTPSPSSLLAMPDEALRSVGLSAAKTLAVKDLAAKVLEGTVPTMAQLNAMDDDEIVERLIQVRGIGRWTVEMLLIFSLGRPDVLPVADLGIRRGFMRTYELDDMPAPGFIRTHGLRWAPYRSVASWYLWRASDQVP
jgi:DNA-3-methyladenine glycosylase II